MYKKAGIIVGGLIIIAALVIFIIASNASKASKNPEGANSSSGSIPVTSSQTQSTSAHSQPSTVAPIPETPVSTPAPTPGSSSVETKPVEQPQEQGTTLIAISGATLPTFVDESDIGTVVGRNIYSYNHQVIYSVVINTTTHGQIEWFTNLTNYNIPDGTRLECKMRIFNATSGAFPSIISVNAI